MRRVNSDSIKIIAYLHCDVIAITVHHNTRTHTQVHTRDPVTRSRHYNKMECLKN